MSIFVNTNTSSLNAQRQLFDTGNSLSTSFERLSSGFRINSASDDAAGLQISDRMTSQIQGMSQGVRNANDGISMLQTAEGALDETTNSLQRMRQLAVQANSGAASDKDRAALDEEFGKLSDEISRIADNTDFGGIKLLDGSEATALEFQVSDDVNDKISVDLTGDYSADGTDVAVDSLDVTTQANAEAAIAAIDTAIEKIGSARAEFGAVQNQFESSIRNISNVAENLSGARSRIQDTDFAAETANLTRNQIMQQASLSVLGQANQRPQAALSLLG